MERLIFKQLEEWKNSTNRKPLVLNGARQVGKTFALKHLGKHFYNNCVYLNFERDSTLHSYFEGDLDPKELIQKINLHTGKAITPHDTLLIFDEIQECPRALNSLKYFYEEANEHHIAAAGSLLGVKIANGQGFPVGKVSFLNLHPMCFSEFLNAMNLKHLAQHLESQDECQPLDTPIHDKLTSILKEYLFVGGMPEAVYAYSQNQNHNTVRDIQLNILQAYEHDFSKHAPLNQVMKISTIWQQAAQQLAKENKKFAFSHIKKSARSRDYEEAIQWLLDAGLLLKSTQITTPKLPLKSYEKSHIFKLFLLDVGLLGAQTKLNKKTIIEGNTLFTEFKGALTENYVAQELVGQLDTALHYWSSTGTAELDFILDLDNQILPLEAKAGTSNKKKSLQVYAGKYKAEKLLRTSLMNLKNDGSLYNIPLYLIGHLKQFNDINN